MPVEKGKGHGHIEQEASRDVLSEQRSEGRSGSEGMVACTAIQLLTKQETRGHTVLLRSLNQLELVQGLLSKTWLKEFIAKTGPLERTP